VDVELIVEKENGDSQEDEEDNLPNTAGAFLAAFVERADHTLDRGRDKVRHERTTHQDKKDDREHPEDRIANHVRFVGDEAVAHVKEQQTARKNVVVTNNVGLFHWRKRFHDASPSNIQTTCSTVKLQSSRKTATPARHPWSA